jgi:N-methylhydantoinase A
VTDANLVLGRIDADNFLGGKMRLDVDAAHAAVANLAEELDLEPLALAEGILDVVNAKMAQAIRTITVEKGIAPSDFAIVAFGGAGAMHAVFLAEELEIPEVIVPVFPGAFSAWGMLRTKLRRDATASYYRPVAGTDRAVTARLFEELAEEGRTSLLEDGVPAEQIDVTYLVDMRYVAQEYSLPVAVTREELGSEDFTALVTDRFHRVYDQRYGHANPEAPVEFVSLRATAYGDLGRAEAQGLEQADGAAPATSTREVVFARRPQDAAVALRDELLAGSAIEGPAIIEEDTATTVVPPGWTASVDGLGYVVISKDGAR